MAGCCPPSLPPRCELPVPFAELFLSELPQDEKMMMPSPVSRSFKGLNINFTRAQLWLREKPQKIKTV